MAEKENKAAGALPACMGMKRYLEIKNGDYPVVVSRYMPKAETYKRQMCTAIAKEAGRLEAGIGAGERKLLGRFARLSGNPDKVIQMVACLVQAGYEKREGTPDALFWIGVETEFLRGQAGERGREAALLNASSLLKEAEQQRHFKNWEVRLILKSACHLETEKETEAVIREAVSEGGIPERRARGLAWKAEREAAEQDGYAGMEGMPGYLSSKEDFGAAKQELKSASFLLHNGALLRRCTDGTRFYRADSFNIEGSYIIPHFYKPVYGMGHQIDYFIIADKRHREVLAERGVVFPEGEGDAMEGEQEKSVLEALKSYGQENKKSHTRQEAAGKLPQEAPARKAERKQGKGVWER